ncbi:MAG: hypothetical protein BGO84_11950 [Dysgonomonas sp. 37-18]|nr:MAG: hypothetical protein BGO84_11950 [Dysgonomonas sp. 37-18]
MILYPILVKKWKQFVDWLHLITYGKSEEEIAEKPKRITTEEDKIASILGKSKFNLRQSTPNTATDLKNENPIEKESTFVPPAKDEAEKFDIDVPLDKVEYLSQEEFDAECEQEELEGEYDAVLASGASYEELAHTNRTIADKQASVTDKDEAGRVLYENKQTEMIEQVIANGAEISKTISTLIDVHLAMCARRLQGDNEIVYPKDFKDFNIDSIF